jgi:N-acetyl-1-D-myo-inositol-2-amino-2-deoxy-alpha-D-glucopyranoside deacetylase
MNKKNGNFTLMAVHAHPDDESIGTGGILAKYADEGHKTVVVFGTKGELGEIQNPEFVPPSRGLSMKDIRVLETERALKVLGVESGHFLGYRDSGMAGEPTNSDPDAFASADMEEAAGKLVDIIRLTKPHVILTYNEKGIYGHPDHIMASRVTSKAFERAGDPDYVSPQGLKPWRPSKLYHTAIPLSRMRMRHQMMQEDGEEPDFDPEVMGTRDDRITTVIDVRKYLPQKLEALYSHESQISPDSFFRRIPEEWKEEAFGFEHFVCVNGCGQSDGKEEDFFEGL